MSKTILISGAAGNLGQVTVRYFLEKGYRVLATVADLNNTPFITEHESLHVFKLDASNDDACKLFVNEVALKFGRIDGLLLLIGGFATGNIHTTSVSDIDKQIKINFTTAFNLAQPAFEIMLKQSTGGRIIFVGSKPGLNARDAKGSLAYALSKALLFRLAEVINIEGNGKNITASVIVPATMDTPANRKAMPDADFSSWVNPEDVAAAMEYICSDQGSALRETVLKIYGNA